MYLEGSKLNMTKNCRFCKTEMEESKRLDIIEYRCSECGHYWFRKLRGQ